MYNPQYLFQGKARNGLVVLLHGYRSDRDAMTSVRDAAHDALPDADVYAPRLPFSQSVWSVCMRRAESIVAELMQAIDSLINERAEAGKPYEQIFFVGHSIGAVLARRLAIIAFGEQSSDSGLPPAPFEPEMAAFRVKRGWAESIRRIILLAGMNRGWSVSSAADWMTSVVWGGMQFIGDTLLRGEPTIMSICQGAPFLGTDPAAMAGAHGWYFRTATRHTDDSASRHHRRSGLSGR